MNKVDKAKRDILNRLGSKGNKIYQAKVYTELKYSAATTKRAIAELVEEDKVVRETKKNKPVLVSNSSWWDRNKGKIIGLILFAVLVAILLFAAYPSWLIWLKSLV